jgi:hypothetical protein
MNDPIAYGPTGIRCGYGKDAHSNLVPCRDNETAAAVAAQGALPVPVGNQPQPLDDTRLAEIAARVEAASKGPWKVCEDYSDVLDGDGHQIISHFHDADGKFTAHAREDVPALLAEIQRLSERVAALEDDKVRLLDRQAKDDDEYVQVLAERDRYRSAWQSARFRAQAYGEGILRHVADREFYQGWLKQAEHREALGLQLVDPQNEEAAS